MNTINATPQLSDEQILKLVNQHYGIAGKIVELPSYIDLNRKITTSKGDVLVIKIANIQHSPEELDFENHVMQSLAQSEDLNLQIPKLVLSKNAQQPMIGIVDALNRHCWMRVITFLDGQLWAEVDTKNLSYATSLGRSLAQIDQVLANVQHPASHRYLKWDIKHVNILIRKYRDSVQDKTRNYLIEQALVEYETLVLPKYSELPTQIIHNDANDHNLLVNSEEKTVSGLFDFGDMVSTFRIAELAIAAAYAIMQKTNASEIIQCMVIAYHQQYSLQAVEVDVLLSIIKARLALSICMSSYQFTQFPQNDYLLISQQGAWQALLDLQKIDQLSFTIKLKFQCGLLAQTEFESMDSLLQYRRTHLSENLSLAYQQPLKIMAGKGAYLYDHKGNRYLDMVNNVCHVGHCHPQVVAAGQQQMATLNTNTRYLHDNIINFSQKLLSTMPDELSVCMFVNSGSEANELAIRLARAYTGRKAMVVVEGAYHGNANACIDISPYKFDGAGGEGAPDWVKQTIAPDPYRGKFRGRNEQTAKNYALDVKRVIKEFEQLGQLVCGFVCESIQGVGGQVIHPEGYLKFAYQAVREAGGVCIADEVQVGMGRVGTHWWAFQTQGVVPDIITIGKPLGNGHPLAAVVTTQAIAKAFVRGMEYFNTFGGNPVSCAIGAAVIDVIQQQDLMQNALMVGNYLQKGLKNLQIEFPIIGDVRGLGLFIGAEFVKDRTSLEPAVAQIDYVIERLKAHGILLTTEGPFHNVLKIKPPMVFSIDDADYFLQTLSSILKEEKAQL